MIQLSHPYIMRVYARGAADIGDEIPVNFYVMDRFAKGTRSADKYVLQEGTSESDILDTLERVVEAIAYIHRQKSVHLDIKPENILVRESGEPVLIDFGFAKELKTAEGKTIIGGTAGYIHPDALAYVTEAESDQNRLRGEVLRTAVRATWDLHPLGRTILRLLELVEGCQAPKLTLYSHRYLKLLAFRLLDGSAGNGFYNLSASTTKSRSAGVLIGLSLGGQVRVERSRGGPTSSGSSPIPLPYIGFRHVCPDRGVRRMASQRPPLPLRNFHGPTHPTRAHRPANPTRPPGGDRHHPGTHGIVHNTKHHA